MEGHILNSTLTSFLVPLFFFFILLLHDPVHAQDADDVCANVDCGRGKCVSSSGSILGYDCECFSGWKKIELGPLVVPACVLPNCTTDLLCGSGAPPPPPPLFSLSDPCSLVWCGDGSCIANGTGHYCQCDQGSSNLLNITSLACLNQCSFGPDCSALGFGLPVTDAQSPPNGMLSPPPPSLTSPPSPTKEGSVNSSNGWRSGEYSNMILLCATILTLVL